MTRDEDVAEAESLGRTEDGVECVDRAPIREEVTLVVMSPRVIAEVVSVVDALGEVKVLELIELDAGSGEVVLRASAFFERSPDGAKESTGLR